MWVLGDVAGGRIGETLGLVRELNGRLHPVAGNHDRCWPLDGSPLNHFPYEGGFHDEDGFVPAPAVDDGTWLLHDHIHQTARQRGRQINVGCDAWALSPVSEDEDWVPRRTSDHRPLARSTTASN